MGRKQKYSKEITIKPLYDGRYNEVAYGYEIEPIQKQVGQIVIGFNDNFKDERLSDTYNQWTKSIPIARLRDRIIYLASQHGVATKVISEAYTSKASYLDQDLMVKGEHSGSRIKRGLYKSKKGILINANQNAALNMIRKGNPNALWIGNN